MNAAETDCDGSRDAPFSKCQHESRYSNGPTQSRSGCGERRSDVHF